MKKSTRNNLIAITVIIIIIVAAVIYTNYTPTEESRYEVIMLDNETPEVNLEYYIIDVDCDSCYDPQEIVDFVESLPGIHLTKIDPESDAITKYDIKKLPTVVLKGDVEKLQIPEFQLSDDALILRDVPAPYFNPETDEVEGKVEILIIENSECTECFKPNTIINNLKAIGVHISKEETIEYTSDKGKELIEKYNIARLPVLIFTDDLLAYTPVLKIWNRSGTIEEDGMLVTREINPPFYAIATGAVRGMVDIITLTDNSCTECYNASVHQFMLEKQFSVKFGSEKKVDVSSEEGKALVEKYNIKFVPTVILSDEAAIYPLMLLVWSNAGSIEDDGSFIVRNLDSVPGVKFMDLSTGEVKTGKK
jgi:thioredoxin-related protein